LNPELCLRSGHIQHRDAQIAVVVQRDLYEPLQAGIGEELSPSDRVR
jgi:hypothetical protein